MAAIHLDFLDNGDEAPVEEIICYIDIKRIFEEGLNITMTSSIHMQTFFVYLSFKTYFP